MAGRTPTGTPPHKRDAARNTAARRSHESAAAATARDWWMLVHQLPPQPPGLRMRVWRRLQELGALQIKGSVYVLPASESAREDLEWLLGEIRAENADASLWRASSIEGLRDDELVLRFQAQARTEYEALAADAEQLRKSVSRRGRSAIPAAEGVRGLARLCARFDDIVRRDYFEAPGRANASESLAGIELRLANGPTTDLSRTSKGRLDPAAYRGRVWATRADVRVDRMASAWLIRRFIDPQARFVYTAGANRTTVPSALHFDTYDGEFTHVGDLCTFEVLLARFALRRPGLVRLGQIIHDIDLKESRYEHAETSGVAASLEAIADGVADDAARVSMAGTLFDGLLKRFARGAKG